MTDIEQLLVEWLDSNPETHGVHWHASVPKDRPNRFGTLMRTGGEETTFDSRPLVSVDAWGSSKPEAHDLANATVRRLKLLPYYRGNLVHAVQIQSCSWDPDVSGQARYHIVLSLMVKDDSMNDFTDIPVFG